MGGSQRRIASHGRALAALLCFTAAAAAVQEFNFQRDCALWIEKHGYSTDYIRQKVGKRQPGTADAWRGNVAVKDVQPGDVVLTLIREKGRSMRASYVEDVRRNADGSPGAVFVSEWNEGRYIDERCFVTDHFGLLSPPRPITIPAIVRVWRPSLPL
jgi:hypothetical protein